MSIKIKQGFNAAAAALGLSILTACTAPPRDGVQISERSGLRHLTSGEIDLAKSIYGQTIDYSQVYIKTGTLPLRSKAFNSVIRFSPHDYAGDFSTASLDSRRTFIHEMEHMRQEQSGTDLVGSAIGLFFEGGYHKAKGYNYGDVKQIDSFSNLNIEQKATLIEDFYVARERQPNLITPSTASENCDFQMQTLEILQPHFPNLQPSPLCDD